MAIRNRYGRWLAGTMLVLWATILFVLVLAAALYGCLIIAQRGAEFAGGHGPVKDALWWLASGLVTPILVYYGLRQFYRWLTAFVRDVADSIEK